MTTSRRRSCGFPRDPAGRIGQTGLGVGSSDHDKPDIGGIDVPGKNRQSARTQLPEVLKNMRIATSLNPRVPAFSPFCLLHHIRWRHAEPCLRSGLAVVLSLALLGAPLTCSAVGAARATGSARAARPLGIVRAINRNVSLNGVRLAGGVDLLPGDRIQAEADSSAALEIGGAIVLVAERTDIVLAEDAVRLNAGRIQARGAAARPLEIDAPFFLVRLAAHGDAPAAAEVAAAATRGRVAAMAGRAELIADGNDGAYTLHPGEIATLELPQQSAAGQGAPAGQVSRLIPDISIERGGQQLAAAPASPVQWNELLRSGPRSRARVALGDGSTLNLGSDS